jgi:polysaccharide biosynthesis transport protein
MKEMNSENGTFSNGMNSASGAMPGGFYPALPGAAINSSPPEKGINYLRLAWGNKWKMLGFILLGLLAGTVYVVLTPPLYRAQTTVEIVGFNQSFMGMNSVDPQAGTDTNTASASNMQTQIAILTSRSLVSRVAERMSLELTPTTSTPNSIFASIRNRIPYLQEDPLVQSREALGAAASTVYAKQVPMTRLLEISCKSTSPDVAAMFVNTLAAEHYSETVAARSNLTQKTSQWMDSQVEEARARLQQAGEKLRDFVAKSGMDFFPEQGTLADNKLKTLQMDVAGIQADRIAKQSRWELAKKTPIDSLPDVMNDANLQGLKGQIAGLRREMAPLTATLTAENPKVRRIQAQITETEATLEKEKAAFLKRVQSDYEEALAREKLLTGAYNAQTHSVSAQADKSAQYATLKREVETEQTLYNSLLQQSTQAALVALAPSSSIRVVDAANPQPTPVSPKPFRDIPEAGLAGGVLGYGIFFLQEMLRRKKLNALFDGPGRSQNVLGVPELGVIPSTQITQPPRKLLFAPNGRRSQAAVSANGDSRARGISVSPSDRSSYLSESFRQTLVSLLRTKPRGHNPVYIISSAGPGEGKTTLSANLARAMAEVGHRVLLVDADLRRPHLHSLLGAGDEPGLSDILGSPIELENLALADYIQPTQVPNLSVMTHGLNATENPAILFFSPKVGELVSLLQGSFDCVLLDTAPAIQFPDARLWGRHSDGVVLVVRAGVTTREGASLACERFLSDGIPVLGTILNDWTPPDSSAHAFYYSHYEKSQS